MIICIDESKKLWEGKIVVWWFVSSHNKSYINRFVDNKKKDFKIQENRELKSSNKFWKLFLEELEYDKDFDKFDIYTFGFVFDNYFFDNQETYTSFIKTVLIKVINKQKIKNLHIIHDKLSLKNKKKFILDLQNYLQSNNCKTKVEILDSQKKLYLQLADLIVSKYKELYLFDDVKVLPEFILKKDFLNKKT